MHPMSRTMQILKYSIKRYVSIELWSKLGLMRRQRNIELFSEVEHHPKSYANSGQVYIIRRQPPGAGLFSNVNHVLQGIIRAQQLGAKPVVDMQNYWTTDSQKGKFLDTKNAWLYFFEPLGGLTLDSAYKSQSVILSRGNRILENHHLSDKGLKFVYKPNEVESLSKIYRENIQLNLFSSQLLNDVKEVIGWDSIDTLGSSFRGTHYTTLEPRGHPRQPSRSDFILKVTESLEKSECGKLFFATDEQWLRQEFQKNVKINLYQEIRSYDFLIKFFSLKYRAARIDKNLISTFGYLLETYLLSETKSIVSTVANGSAAAIIINGNKYIDPIIFDFGTY